MEEFIKDLYDNANVILETKKLIKNCRKGQAHLFKKKWETLQQPITDFCKNIAALDNQLGLSLWNEYVLVAKDIDNSNLNLAADRLEELIPHLYKAMSLYGEINVDDDNYRFFSTKSGYLGLQNLLSNDYLTGIIDPAWENFEIAVEMYRPTMTRFCTLGCNLGYLCWQMYEVSYQSIDIYIYDLNDTMYNYAINYGVLSNIPEERIHLIVEDDSAKLVKSFMSNYDSYSEDKTILYMEADTVDKLTKDKDTVLDLFTTLNSDKNLFGLCQHNFYRNINNVHKNIYSFNIKNPNKEFIIVGGGPSVDYNLDYIKENVGKKTIIVATTVYNKIINLGITPDAMVCVDPQNRTYGHLVDATNHSVPLIMTDMANWQFSEKYKGTKYIIPTGDYFFAKNYHSINSTKTWATHGTVVGTCIDIAVFLGAKEIDLIGVDLSYPTSTSHASGTMDNSPIDNNTMIKIKSVDGKDVYTSKIFKYYITRLEQQISKYSSVKFYNLSKDGAYISGAKSK